MSIERACKNWGEEKKARGGRGGEKEKEKRRLQTTHCSKICMAVGGLSILIGQFWLFHQQFSQHVGILSFLIVMMACSFENVLKLKPPQESACMLDLKDLLQKKLGPLAVNKKSICWTLKTRAKSSSEALSWSSASMLVQPAGIYFRLKLTCSPLPVFSFEGGKSAAAP